tara:strand:+ start:332 stop:1363 length:1032 start_codon:yes stop_codon:yes gene_type:complete
MAYTTIDKSTDYFNTTLYTGTAAELAVTDVGFQPDLTWIKNRTAAEIHIITDSVRGATEGLSCNSAGAEITNAQNLKSFDSGGFTVGTEVMVNGSTNDIASFNWLAGGTPITGSGSLTNTRSTNATAGISIIKYASTSTASSTIAHGLGVAPDWVWIKQLGGATSWILWCTQIGATTNYFYPNTTAAVASSTDWLGVDATNITLKTTWGELNTTGDYVCYAFAQKQGFSKQGQYSGNGNADGSFVYTGFAPAFVWIKSETDAAGTWVLTNNKAPGYNPTDKILLENAIDAEVTSSGDKMSLLSTGFKLQGTSSHVNGNDKKTIYMAFAAAPMLSSAGIVGTAL